MMDVEEALALLAKVGYQFYWHVARDEATANDPTGFVYRHAVEDWPWNLEVQGFLDHWRSRIRDHVEAVVREHYAELEPGRFDEVAHQFQPAA